MRRHSLYTIFLIVFIILIIIIFVALYFSIVLHRQDLINASIEEKVRLAKTVDEVLSSPQYYYEISKAPGLEKAIISEMAKFKDVIYIRVLTAEGVIYRSSVDVEWGEKMEESNIKIAVESKKLAILDSSYNGKKIKEIIYPSRADRAISVAFSLDSVEERIKSIFYRDAIVNVLIFLITFVIFFIVVRGIIIPLKEITKACLKIRKGNLNTRINIKSKTEIGELANTFNDMVLDLKKYNKALNKSKAELEQRVEERTKELKDLSENLEEQVNERTTTLQEKMQELERFNKLAVGRELKMISLKKEIARLKK
ncbi:MAG: HAMP domain-containing protein [Patescibacteria group bacterium]